LGEEVGQGRIIPDLIHNVHIFLDSRHGGTAVRLDPSTKEPVRIDG
jgi:hypothetical protein